MAKKQVSIERVHMRYVDAHDAGRVVLASSIGQAVLEYSQGRTTEAAVIGAVGVFSWVSSVITSNVAHFNHWETLFSKYGQHRDARPSLNPIDYANGIGMAVIELGIANEVIAASEHSKARMLVGAVISCIGLVGMSIGGHYRPDLELSESEAATTSLQPGSDLLE